MIVTDIQYIDKKKSRVFIDGKKAFVIYRGELLKYNIAAGNEIDADTFNTIMYDVLKKRVRLRALHILEKQDRTRKQLIDKLTQNEYPNELIDDAVAYVESYHYIDDERYARQYIRYNIEKKSKRQITNYLFRRGIDKEITMSAYDDVVNELQSMSDATPESDDFNTKNNNQYNFEENQIKKIISKKLPDENATLKDKQRVYRYLLGKGYSSSDICKYLNVYE